MEGQNHRYEFTPAQNKTIERTATWATLVAWILMGSAGFMALGAVLTGEASAIGALIAAAIYFIIGLNFRDAAASMRAVADTAGNDIEHLMIALDKLGSALKVMGILFLVGVVLFVMAIVSIWMWMGSLEA